MGAALGQTIQLLDEEVAALRSDADDCQKGIDQLETRRRELGDQLREKLAQRRGLWMESGCRAVVIDNESERPRILVFISGWDHTASRVWQMERIEIDPTRQADLYRGLHSVPFTSLLALIEVVRAGLISDDEIIFGNECYVIADLMKQE